VGNVSGPGPDFAVTVPWLVYSSESARYFDDHFDELSQSAADDNDQPLESTASIQCLGVRMLHCRTP
jgi:hypothetical protein